jgi:hypothetical protein
MTRHTSKNRSSELVHTTRRLADLLHEAAPLVELLDSPNTPQIYRTLLRFEVSNEHYLALVNNMQHMISPEMWKVAHAQEFLSPELARKVNQVLARDGVPDEVL